MAKKDDYLFTSFYQYPHLLHVSILTTDWYITIVALSIYIIIIIIIVIIRVMN